VRNRKEVVFYFLARILENEERESRRKNVKDMPLLTRSQAVARIADRTASQHLWGHVTSSGT